MLQGCKGVLAGGVALVFLTLAPTCTRNQVRPAATERFSVFVSGDVRWEDMPKLAGAVATAKRENPVFWVVAGEVFDPRSAALTDGAGDVVLLSRAGVDAVILGGSWLRFGIPRAKELVDRAGFRVLGFNLTDTAGLPLGHPWMTKRVNGVQVAVSGLIPEGSEPLLHTSGVRVLPAGYGVRKLRALVRDKADLLILVAPESLAGADGALILTPASYPLVRYEITLSDRRISEVRKSDVSLVGVEPEPEVERVLDSLGAVLRELGSVPVVESRVNIPRRALARAVVEGYLGLREVDAFLYDSSAFVRETVPAGTLDRALLISVLGAPARLVLVDLEGEELRRLVRECPGLVLEMRPGLRGRMIMARKTYRVATTFDVFKSNPRFSGKGFELSRRQLWEYAEDVLRAQGKR